MILYKLFLDPKLFNYSLTGQVLEEVMDAKYLGVTLSNDLSGQITLQPWQTRLTPSFRFCVATWRAAQRSLSKLQTAYFSLIRSFMEYGATVWDPYQKYNSDKIERVQRRAARFVKSRYSRYSSVSDMLDELGWTPRSDRRLDLSCFTKLLTVWHKCPSKAS